MTSTTDINFFVNTFDKKNFKTEFIQRPSLFFAKSRLVFTSVLLFCRSASLRDESNLSECSEESTLSSDLDYELHFDVLLPDNSVQKTSVPA